jgi:hypothetical protein
VVDRNAPGQNGLGLNGSVHGHLPGGDGFESSGALDSYGSLDVDLCQARSIPVHHVFYMRTATSTSLAVVILRIESGGKAVPGEPRMDLLRTADARHLLDMSYPALQRRGCRYSARCWPAVILPSSLGGWGVPPNSPSASARITASACRPVSRSKDPVTIRTCPSLTWSVRQMARIRSHRAEATVLRGPQAR